MKRIKAIIEKASDGGYGIYAEGDIPVFSGGLTEQEAKNEFESLIHEQAEFIKEQQGKYPEWYSDDLLIDYRYDMSSGIAKAGERQKDLIQRKFDDIVSRLSAVRF